MSFYVYILSNQRHTVYYTGITNDLIRRIYQHKNKLADSFTKKYNVNKLLYYEEFQTSNEAIEREKQIKGYRRKKKLNLINSSNPEWVDLYNKLVG